MKRIILWTGASLTLLWLLIPIPEVVSPDWTVFVTDAAGQPIPDATVTVFSQDYTVQTQGVETAKVTGKDGLVHFDKIRTYGMGLMKLFGAIRNLDQGAHASFGVHTFLHATKTGYGVPTAWPYLGKTNMRVGQTAQSNSPPILCL